MASQFDESDFVDGDFVSTQKTFSTTGFAAAPTAAAPVAPSPAATTSPTAMNRPPSREEIETKVSDTQARLAELKRAQELLERERASLEEARRKRIEFQNGRAEMLEHLTRGVGILEESEITTRRNAEQMKQTVSDMRSALEKVHGLREDGWTDDNWQQELVKALTTLENARMEWNSARVKFAILDGALKAPEAEAKKNSVAALQEQSFFQLCKLGLALTWPVALVVALGVAISLLWK